MFSPEEVASRPRRWCTSCLAAGAKVEAAAVEHGAGFGARFACGACARRAAALGARLEPVSEFWDRVAVLDAAGRLGGEV